jgi:hypothetical protein
MNLIILALITLLGTALAAPAQDVSAALNARQTDCGFPGRKSPTLPRYFNKDCVWKLIRCRALPALESADAGVGVHCDGSTCAGSWSL